MGCLFGSVFVLSWYPLVGLKENQLGNSKPPRGRPQKTNHPFGVHGHLSVPGNSSLGRDLGVSCWRHTLGESAVSHIWSPKNWTQTTTCVTQIWDLFGDGSKGNPREAHLESQFGETRILEVSQGFMYLIRLGAPSS